MSKRVLIVDDDAAILRLLEKQLGLAGYEVLSACDGREALKIMQQEGPQLVITDWTMPGMDGIELIRAIRSSEGTGFVFVIMLTAHAGTSRIVEAFEAGADDFLPKPVNREELLARLTAGVRIIGLEADLAKERRDVHRANAEMALLNRKLKRMATTDELTQLVNRREALRRLGEHWATAERYNHPFSCMMLDIDHFKRFNDTYGHDAGDVVLRTVADTLQRLVRTGETVCRLGGEEFLVLCPNSTAQMAVVGAERLRVGIESSRIEHDGVALDVTVSAGVAGRDGSADTPGDLLKRADDALYAAKRAGRNRVCAVGDSQPPELPAGSPKGTSLIRPTLFAEGLVDSSVTVLVVDDDAAIRRLCRAILQREGYEIMEACDGVGALAKIRKCPPDAIIMDVAMPNMDGLECTRRLKAGPETRDIPIIMISGLTRAEDTEAGLEAGVDEYITKPFSHKEFALRVRSMARQYKRKAELVRSNAVRGEQTRTLEILLQLSRSLAAAESLEVILEKTTLVAAQFLSSRRVSIMLPDHKGEYLTIAKSIGINENIAATVRVPVGDAIAGQVFLSGEGVVINTREEVKQQGDRYDGELFASVPLTSRALGVSGSIVGVLNATERLGGRPFELHELECLDLICNMAASAIEESLSCQARDEARDSIVVALATLAEYRDRGTGRHLDRVTGYASILAEELRRSEPFSALIDDTFVQDLQRAMPLHDVGKVAIPDNVLLKPGKLTPEEMKTMKRHAEVGAEALRSVMKRAPGVRFLEMASQIAMSHHEWYDGSGYPEGIRGTDIPLAARIAALADVYDADTTKRCYKDAMSHETAAQIIHGSCGSQFDPAVVEAFARREDEFIKLAAELRDRVDPLPEPERSQEADLDDLEVLTA